jgi:alpha-beta hydrolase superfamily lysophospholipase
LAQPFAKAGYDFVCMDNRGFGHSEGRRAYIESEETMMEDVLKFHDLVDSKFGGKDVPKLLLG